jgi:hypothetical protein
MRLLVDIKMAASCPIVFIPVLLLLVSFLFALYHAHMKYDPREPPIIHHRVPYVGHVIDIFRYGAKYFETLQYGTPFSTPHSNPNPFHFPN